MTRCLQIAVLLLVWQPAFASLVVLTGGSLTAQVTAGDSSGTIGTDDPAPVAPQFGSSSLSASASGIINAFCLECPDIVSGTAVSSSKINEDSSGAMRFELSSRSSTSLAHVGPGVWVGANAQSSVSVDFSLTSEALAKVEWSGLTYWGVPSGRISKDGNVIFSGLINDFGPMETFLFKPGQYNLFIESIQGGSDSPFNAYTSATLNLTVFVPIPAALGLFGSGLTALMCFRAGRRKPYMES